MWNKHTYSINLAKQNKRQVYKSLYGMLKLKLNHQSIQELEIVTVDDVLNLTILEPARLLAGAAGLNRPVRWMHVVDQPDVTKWVRGGEIVLTTGEYLIRDLALQERIIPDLAHMDLAAIFIKIGRFVKQVPEVLLVAGESYGFPVVDLPWQIRFIDIIQVVHEMIVNEQYAVLNASMAIHDDLMNVVLSGGGLQEVAKTLSDHTGHPVAIENPNFELLACANRGQIDEAHRAGLASGCQSPKFINELETSGILAEVIRNRRPVIVTNMPEHGLSLGRVLTPIFAGGELLGFLWLVADESELNESVVRAVEHGSTVSALALLQERTRQQSVNRMRGSLLARLLTDRPHRPADLSTLGSTSKLDPTQSHRVIVVDTPRPDQTVQETRLLEQIEAHARELGIRTFAGWLGQHMVIVGEQCGSKDRCRELSGRLSSDWPGCAIGIGGSREGLIDLGGSFEEALEALYARKALTSGAVVAIEDLGLYHWLQLVPESALSKNPYLSKIGKLAQYDKEHKGALVETLEAYLDAGGNATKTAMESSIHRNTLFYRLRRIGEICELDLSDPSVSLNMHVALKGYRLHRDVLVSDKPRNT
jgi:purine catabolism regulator